jgi:hypothetical protein
MLGKRTTLKRLGDHIMGGTMFAFIVLFAGGMILVSVVGLCALVISGRDE